MDQDGDGLVDDSVTNGLEVVFELPSGSVALVVESAVLPAEWSSLPPDVATTHDIAVLTLAVDAPATAPRYPLYGGDDEVGQRVVVTGFGVTGHGSVGMDA